MTSIVIVKLMYVPESNFQEWFSEHQLFQSASDKKQCENDIPIIFLSPLEVSQIPTCSDLIAFRLQVHVP